MTEKAAPDGPQETEEQKQVREDAAFARRVDQEFSIPPGVVLEHLSRVRQARAIKLFGDTVHLALGSRERDDAAAGETPADTGELPRPAATATDE